MSTILRKLREEYKMSLQEVCNETNISRSVFNRLELGLREINANHTQPLCNLFMVTSDYLLGFSQTGIKCITQNKEIIISQDEYDRYKTYIMVGSNHKRIISQEAVARINEERAGENYKTISSLLLHYSNELDRQIMDILNVLSDEQKKVVLHMLKGLVNA